MAQVAADYFDSSARKTETYLGWGRATVQLGLHERRVGVECQGNYRARGDKTTEEKQPQLEADIRQLVDGQSQADPRLRTTFYLCQSERPGGQRRADRRERIFRRVVTLAPDYRHDARPNGLSPKKTQKVKPHKKCLKPRLSLKTLPPLTSWLIQTLKCCGCLSDTKAKVSIGNLLKRRQSPSTRTIASR